MAELQSAIEIAPNDSDVLSDLALALSFAVNPEEGLRFALRAQELNPSHPKSYFASSGISLLLSGIPDRAARHLQSWSEANSGWYLPLIFLAAAQGNAGDVTNAKSTLKRAFRQRHYEIMVPAVRRSWPMNSEQEEIFIKGLRIAGMREQPF